MRRSIVAGAALTLSLATVPLAVHYWPKHAFTFGFSAPVAMLPVPLGTLTPADAALVKDTVHASTYPSGSLLTALKAPGAKVWAAFNADVYVGPDTAAVKSHDLIVALVRFPAPILAEAGALGPGSPAPMISGRSWIIDSTNGRVVEISDVGDFTPDGHTPLPSILGTPTNLTDY